MTRSVVAPSFGDIFTQNSVKNGLLTPVLNETDTAELAAAVAGKPDQPISVDLEEQSIACGNHRYAFVVDPVSRNKFLNGWADIDLTDYYRDKTAAFKSEDQKRRPWAVPRKT